MQREERNLPAVFTSWENRCFSHNNWYKCPDHKWYHKDRAMMKQMAETSICILLRLREY